MKKPTRLNRLLRDREVIGEDYGSGYMTDTLGHEAARYIERHKDAPFFMYLCFNAVHGPMHAKPEELEKVTTEVGPKRRKLIAMTVSLDQAVGVVLDALAQHGLTDDTLLFFVNDNGGARNNASENRPLRGRKGTPFEGGIRVPFVAQWPGALPKGKVYERPVSTLDILPTSVAASGGEWQPRNPLDGVDLLPFLRGDSQDRPHDELFWRRGESKVARLGDLKLVSDGGGDWMLFDLAADEAEKNDLAGERAEDVARLAARYAEWVEPMVVPKWRYKRRKK